MLYLIINHYRDIRASGKFQKIRYLIARKTSQPIRFENENELLDKKVLSYKRYIKIKLHFIQKYCILCIKWMKHSSGPLRYFAYSYYLNDNTMHFPPSIKYDLGKFMKSTKNNKCLSLAMKCLEHFVLTETEK